MKHLTFLYAVLCMAAFLFITQTLQARSHKNADSSTLETPPIYGLEGTLGSRLLGAYHQRATTADGTTYSAWCDTNPTSVDCNEGTGLIHFVTLADGRSIQYGCENCLPVDLDHSDGLSGFELVPLSDAPIPFSLKDGNLIHFRLRRVIHIGYPEDYLCVPLLHLPELPDGKARASYAKHHSMESCIMYTP
ncbi:MAG: hypothetical protein ABR860_04220 [Terracidiphilus sp.]|jgi:hypothetical protein